MASRYAVKNAQQKQQREAAALKLFETVGLQNGAPLTVLKIRATHGYTWRYYLAIMDGRIVDVSWAVAAITGECFDQQNAAIRSSDDPAQILAARLWPRDPDARIPLLFA